MRKSRLVSMAVSAVMAGVLSSGPAAAGDGQVTFIHMGDIHGHLVGRPNLRSDGSAGVEGGLARMYTKIQQIRSHNPHNLLVNTGDTIQGSAEALYTKGQSMVDVLNLFGIDAFAPGNWDFVYGTERFIELFAGPTAKAKWGAVSANLYYDGEPYASKSGQRVLPPYIIKQVGNVRIGIIGFTTDRGPTVVGPDVTKGFKLTTGEEELRNIVPGFVPRGTKPTVNAQEEARQLVHNLRQRERVDLVVVISELGLANNIRLAEEVPGIDVLLSSDMHEISTKPVVTRTGTVVVEEGQDGTVLGEMAVTVKNGRKVGWSFKLHRITTDIPENPIIARAIRKARAPFVSGPNFRTHVNPFNGTFLKRPIDTVIGYTNTPLYRGNFSDETMPGVIEGSSHDFLADAFRAVGGTELGMVRGFRYGTHVAPGKITLDDIYHYMPIGAMIATGTVKGQTLKNLIENSAHGSLSRNPADWTGGWVYNFSGLTFDLDPYSAKGIRASNIRANKAGTMATLDPNASYSIASYWFSTNPGAVNGVPASNIRLVTDAQGNKIDGPEVVARYLEMLPRRTAQTQINRIRLLRPLDAPRYGFKEVQPLGNPY